MNLKEWTGIFLRQRDLIKREIQELKEEEKGFLIITKTGQEKRVRVAEDLDKEDVNLPGTQVISTLNKKKNVIVVVNNWKAYAEQEDLLIVFAHPQRNEKWLLKPYHHEKISDKGSLKQGLLAMHDAISSM